jgi:hypothetical protein
MSRSNSNKLCVVVGLALVIGIAVFLAWPPSSPTMEPGVTELSRTNDPAAGLSVLFNLTNRSDSKMSYIVSAPEIKTDDLMFPDVPVLSGFYLRPHQATNFLVKLPSETDTWRVPVSYSYLPSDTERLRYKIRYNLVMNWIALKHGEKPKWFRYYPSDSFYMINALDVTILPKTETEGAANSPVR